MPTFPRRFLTSIPPQHTYPLSLPSLPLLPSSPGVGYRQTIRKQSHGETNSGLATPTRHIKALDGLLQCNVVILPREYAADFTLFCLRNPKPCPLLDICVGSDNKNNNALSSHRLAHTPNDVLRDVGSYIFFTADGREINQHIAQPPTPAVAFLLGCSFSWEAELMRENLIDLAAPVTGNVPMYITSIPTNPCGIFSNVSLVVSYRAYHRRDVTAVVTRTNKYAAAHGGPVHVGDPYEIGIHDLNHPQWGNSPKSSLPDDSMHCFWACGVTPLVGIRNAIKRRQLPWAITHSPGVMFVSDVDVSTPLLLS